MLSRLNARSERAVPAAVLLGVTLLCWTWIVPMARDMYSTMSGRSAWMMTRSWDTQHVALLFAMWTIMMTGMMLPSASPLLMLYGGAMRKRDKPSATSGVYAMAAGYLVVWTAFSAIATALQRVLAGLLLLSPMMEATSPIMSGGLLIVAGAYQLTPLKRACLQSCRSPLAFLATRWRRGVAGAFRMGLEHGSSCLGCCWALMLLLFAGGVMNLWVIAVLAGVVLVERFLLAGAQGARLLGLLLLGAGCWIVG